MVRTVKLARYLPAAGVTADVLTSFDPAPWPDGERAREVPQGTVVARAAGLLPWQWPKGAPASRDDRPGPGRPPRRAPTWLRGLVSVPDRGIYWAPFAVREGARLGRERGYDAIYGMGGPWSNAIVARGVAERLGAPLVLDFKEPWGCGPPLGWPNPLRRRLETAWERRAVRAARLMFCGSEGILEDLRARILGIPADRFALVPNGWDPDDFAGPAPEAAPGPFRVVHTGYLSRGFDVRPAIEGVRRAAEAGTSLRVVFVGEEDLGIREIAEGMGAAGLVEVRGPVSGVEAVRAQRGAGGLLLLGSRSPLPGGAMPSKAYEYLATGRPILAIAPPGGAIGRFLERAGLPPVLAPGDAAGIAARLADMAAGRVPGGRPEQAAPYRWPDLVRRTADLLRQRIGTGRPRNRLTPGATDPDPLLP